MTLQSSSSPENDSEWKVHHACDGLIGLIGLIGLDGLSGLSGAHRHGRKAGSMAAWLPDLAQHAPAAIQIQVRLAAHPTVGRLLLSGARSKTQ